MARACQICGKTYNKVVKRSHSMQANPVRLQPNLQWIKKDNKKIKVCTRCIKTMSKPARKK